MTQALERFLRYVKVDTPSSSGTGVFPSTPCQWDLAHMLVDEMKAMGLEDVNLDPYCIVTATLPANNAPKGTPSIGFIAHMDTVNPGNGVNPRVIDSYDGGDIVLNEELNVVLSPSMFPYMTGYKGERLVVTDGTTVLGADDKAGIASILTAVEELMAHPEIPHSKIRIAFTPDEEVGAGTANFVARDFGVDFGYTMDGGGIGGMSYENFNAACATVTVHGNSIHPGSAKGYMVHAATIAAEFVTMVPTWERAETTAGKEGFYHLNGMQGEVENAQLSYILRDFDSDGLERRKVTMNKIAETLNARYGEGTVEVVIEDQYRNMLERVQDHPEVVTLVRDAMASLGIEMQVGSIRGGTDGANISNMEGGFPCPNVSSGGCNGHGKFEFLVESHLLAAVEVVKRISALAAGAKF